MNFACDWSSLVGSDKKKLMNLLPAILKAQYAVPRNKNSHQSLESWKEWNFPEVESFVNLLSSLGGDRIGYENKRVTPHLHALLNHVLMFIKKITTTSDSSVVKALKKNDNARKYISQNPITGIRLGMFCFWNTDKRHQSMERKKKGSTANGKQHTGRMASSSYGKMNEGMFKRIRTKTPYEYYR